MDELLIVAIRLPGGTHPNVREEIERIVENVGADRQASFAAGPVSHYAQIESAYDSLARLVCRSEELRGAGLRSVRRPLREALHTLGLADDRLIEADGQER